MYTKKVNALIDLRRTQELWKYEEDFIAKAFLYTIEDEILLSIQIVADNFVPMITIKSKIFND